MKVTDLKAEAKQILTIEDNLCDECEVINPKEEADLLQEIVLSLKETMKVNNLEALSAPQLGYNKRVCCIRFGGDTYRTYVNPMIYEATNMFFSEEKCPSLPGKRYIIPRCGKIGVAYFTPMGVAKSNEFIGPAAAFMQRCIEYFDGVTMDAIGLEIDELWDVASDEERNEIMALYAQALDLKHKQVKEDIEQDEELSKIADAGRFIESVRKGETNIEIEPIKNIEGGISDG